ncbi:glycosyltransferase family 4 protein [Parasphingopyxis sp. CP4]|uniref:glycosyltransferase family 4 protein n=1 Tax=Parasphingopyxis sp. CP4 TaxID=2724527 RepID=UPI00159FE793|nr:glycosyltransferase family 4 protein [Parasphingopyxis sp. CP4]QLC22988.1 glycosyltransferase family 4 protein [Parasphingopyxis sp. CP4]
MQTDTFDVRRFPSLDKFVAPASENKLEVLIATEEIIGPVRNGGIASTYYHLARGLAADGHKVTVLYLKGRTVENETPEHWIDHYASFGIELVYLPDLENELYCASAKWQWRWLSFYRWLKANDRFDMVHTSEWRGGAFYCLQAKRLGLAFHDTLFVMKTSSPYIWNRHYQMRPIDKAELIVAAFAEQKCVEWSDIVVGGSAHLLSFMDYVGYQLPEGHTYVQPNIVDFSEVLVDDQRPRRELGDTVKTGELVFFGRLEPRKGLELFVFAIDALVANGAQIDKITFLGKEGEKLQGQGNIKPGEFIEAHAKHWPFPIEIVTDRNQPEALSLMCSREMIAVMPSLIENSTMAVYEALVHRIPFIATRVGGTPELIDAIDHDATLVQPQVQNLADTIARALEHGQPIARPAFDNDDNLATWYGFHRYVASEGHRALASPPEPNELASTIAYISAPANLGMFSQLVESRSAESLAAADHIVIVSFLPTNAVREQIAAAQEKGFTIIEMIGASTGECLNAGRAQTDAEIIICEAAGVTEISEDFFPTVRKAMAVRPADILTTLYQFRTADMEDFNLFVPLGGDVATQTISGDAYGVEIVIGRRDCLDSIGEFEGYRVDSGTVHEFVGRAAANGRELFVVPEPLFSVEISDDQDPDAADPTGDYLVRKPVLDGVDLTTRKLLLLDTAKTGGGGSKPNRGPIIMAKAHRREDNDAWLTNVDRLGRPDDPVRFNDAIYLGFDRDIGVLHVAMRHKGELLIKANGEILKHDLDTDTKGELAVSEIPLAPLLERRPKTHLRIELINDERVRAAGLAVQRLEPNVYYLSSHRPIFWGNDFFRLIEKVEQHRAAKQARKSQRATKQAHNAANDLISGSDGRSRESAELTVLGRLRKKIGI